MHFKHAKHKFVNLYLNQSYRYIVRTGASLVRYTTKHCPFWKCPLPMHMYSIDVNHITYLEQLSGFWLSQICILNMPNIHLQILKNPQFIEVHRENRGFLRMAYCITKNTPFWNYSLSLAFVFHLYRLCNITALHFQLLIVKACSLYIKNCYVVQLRNTRFTEVHPWTTYCILKHPPF